MKNALVLVSGGIDSVVTAYYAKNRLNYNKIIFFLFDYGQRAIKEEEYCSRRIAKILNAEFKKINIRWLKEISTAFINKEGDIPKTTDKDLEGGRKDIINWWVPCRNSIFLVNSLAHAEFCYLKKQERYDILIGLKNEGKVHMKDTTKRFISVINKLAEEATHHGGYKILAPLIDMDKTEVTLLGKKLGVPFQLTYSCYIENGFENGKVVHCGECLNCMLRKKGFYWAGVEDPSLYKFS